MGEKYKYTVCQQNIGTSPINVRTSTKEETRKGERTVDIVYKFVENLRNKIDPRTCLGLKKCESSRSRVCCCCEHCMQQANINNNQNEQYNQIVPYMINKNTTTNDDDYGYFRIPPRAIKVDEDENYEDATTLTNLKAIEYEPIKMPPEISKENKETTNEEDKVSVTKQTSEPETNDSNEDTDKKEKSKQNKKGKEQKIDQTDDSNNENNKNDKSKQKKQGKLNKNKEGDNKDVDSIASKASAKKRDSLTLLSRSSGRRNVEEEDDDDDDDDDESPKTPSQETKQDVYQYSERTPILPIISSNKLSYYVHLDDKNVEEPNRVLYEQMMDAPTVTSKESEMSLTIIRLNSTLPDVENISKLLPKKHSSKCKVEVNILEKHTDKCVKRKPIRNNSDDSYDVIQKYIYETCLDDTDDNNGSKLSPSLKGFHLNDPSLFKAPLLVKRSHVDLAPVLPKVDRVFDENTTNKNKKKEAFGYVSESGTLKLNSSVDDGKTDDIFTYFMRSEENANTGCVKNKKKHYTGDSCCLKDPSERAKQLLELQRIVKELEPGAQLANVNKKFSTHKNILGNNQIDNTMMMVSTAPIQRMLAFINAPKEQSNVDTQTSKHNFFNLRKKARNGNTSV